MANEDLEKPEMGVDMDPVTGRFLPGNRSKGGRPKGTISLTTILKDRLELLSPDERRNAAEVIVENIIQDAMDGDRDARKLVWNYTDGMPRQQTDITSGGNPIPIFGNVQDDNRNQEDTGPDETN